MRTITIKDKEYQCYLSTRAVINVEKRIGKPIGNLFYGFKSIPYNNLSNAQEELEVEFSMPSLNDMLIILYESMTKYNHGIKQDDIYDIYDDYCDEGHDMYDLFEFIMDLLEDAGITGKGEVTKEAVDSSKN